MINYMAGKRPEAPSPLRQLAYENGTPIPGPKEDPDYWETLESVTIAGTINNREVQVECQVSILTYFKPCTVYAVLKAVSRQTCESITTADGPNIQYPRIKLCYTRGTAIPCVLGLESDDEEALALLSAPKSISLRLMRVATWRALEADPDYHKEFTCSRGALDYPANATWGAVIGTGNQRRLEGEIQLPSRAEATLKYDENYSVSVSFCCN